MSRTWKDTPRKFRKHYDSGNDTIRVEYEAEITKTLCLHTWQVIELATPIYKTRFCVMKRKTTKPKVRKSENTKWFWYRGAPGWWVSMFMNRPQRRAGRVWERKVLFEDVEETDPPGVSRKPFKYYY